MSEIGRKNAEKMLEKVQDSPRLRWGWGTPEVGTTSPEERAAYEYLEKKPLVESGELSVRDLPEDYGGRPQGSSRRAFRQQQAWDAGYAAELERQEQIRKIADEKRKAKLDDLKYESEYYDLRTKQNEDLFELRTAADLKQAEAEFTDFRNKLNPNDPASAGMIYSYISSDPRLAESKVAYTSAEFFDKAAKNSVVSIANQEQEKKTGIINSALRDGVTEQEIEATKFADPKTAIVDYNYEEIAKLAAQRAGERKAEKPEETPEEKRAKATEEEISDERKGLKSSIRNLEDSIAETESNLETYRANSPDRKKVEAKISTLKKQLEKRQSQLDALSSGTAQTTVAPSSVPTINSPEELNNLPSGAEYIAPNGKKYKKL